MYSLAGINTKELCNFPEKKDFALLRVLNLFIKSFVNPFVDIALNFLIVYSIHFYEISFTKYPFCLLNLLVLVLQ